MLRRTLNRFSTLLIFLAHVACSGSTPSPDIHTLAFVHEGTDVEIAFHGEVTPQDLFGERGVLPVTPLDQHGNPEGEPYAPVSSWLKFTYRIGQSHRHVLISKLPLMNEVSWNAIARAGAAFSDDSTIQVEGAPFAQDARITAEDGTEYRVRLPECGRSTTAHLSEWNLLVGAVHEGDPDFAGERYGWVPQPYTDEELKLGHDGSLNWCQERWRAGLNHRVVRGYFYASRFHATESSFRGERVYWRPVLEAEDPAWSEHRSAPYPVSRGEHSPFRDVVFLGTRTNDEVLGFDRRITDEVAIDMGTYVGPGRPDWLHFQHDGTTLLVAMEPVKHSVSWDAIAQAGAVSGDDSVIQVRGGGRVQSAQIADAAGNLYRVRLLRCGMSTLDYQSEWNMLIGGIHVGDGDFSANRDGRFGWVSRPFTDSQLHVGELDGSATWCQERRAVQGRDYAVNRGYLTVSRFHLTETSFRGHGFGWRPVLELVP